MSANWANDVPRAPAAAQLRLVGFLLIVIQAAVLGCLTRTFAFPIGVSVFCLYGVLSRQRVAWSRNQCLVVLVTLAALFSVKYQLMPHQMSMDALFVGTRQTLVIGQFLLVAQIGQFFLAREGDRLPLWLPGMGMAAMVCLTNVRVEPEERTVCQFLTLAFVAGAALYFGASRSPIRRLRPSTGGQRNLVSALVLLTIAGLSWSAGTAVYRYEKQIELWLADVLIDRERSLGELGFSRNARLTQVARRKLTNEHQLALRVYTSTRPGYLRGMAYDNFNGTEWRISASSRDYYPEQWLPIRIAERARGENVFSVKYKPAQSPAWSRMEIWPDPTLQGTLFTRMRTAYVQAPVDVARINPYGIVECEDIPAGFPFTTYTPMRSAWSKEPIPNIIGIEKFLTDGYPKLDVRVQGLAERITAECRTTEEKLAAVQAYFHSNYKYDLSFTPPDGVADRLSWFLLNRPSAHCEYFAAGTVMLLRAVGVPCRYVTGFVVTEHNAVGDYWVARNRDAHAWAEAYDDDQGWVIVESTPAEGVPNNSPLSSRWAQLWELLREGMQMFRIRLQQGGLPWLGMRLLDILLTPVPFVLLVVAIAARVYWRVRQALLSRGRRADPVVRKTQRLLGRVDARLRKRKLVRRPGETLHSFADRIERLPDEDVTAVRATAAWYRSYAELRYRGSSGEEELRRLATTAPGRGKHLWALWGL